jgi:hypothetical protein
MKKLAVVFVASVVALFSVAAYAGTRPFTESQALTRAAPTLSTEGVSMSQITAFRVSVCATTGNTLSGSGTLKAYLYNPAVGLWMRNPSLDVAVTNSGERCQVFPDFTVTSIAVTGSAPYRTLFATSAVTVSGGTTVDVRIDAYGPAAFVD